MQRARLCVSATRPGALEHVTVTNYRKRRIDPKTGHSVMLVPQHKRGVDEPAMLLDGVVGMY